jgi:guanylate kinase
MKKNIIWAIVGPSGSGKTSVGAGSLKGAGVPEIVSHTTRAMREGEVEGINYYYVTKEDFDKLEKVEEVCYSGNYYCTSKNEIENKFKTSNELCVVVSIEGVEALRKCYGDVVKSVFMNIDRDICIQRMYDRGDSEEAIQKRIKNFDESKEFENGPKCDYIYNCPLNMDIEDNKKDFLKFINEIRETL